MSELQRFEFPEAGRCVYVIEYSGGTIKVGYSSKPAARLRALVLASWQLGRPVTRAWASAPHANAARNERHLISFCAEHGRRTTGAQTGEYFAGVTFDAAREYADSLPKEPETTDEASGMYANCAVCDAVDDLPLTMLGLMHAVLTGDVILVDRAGQIVNAQWTGGRWPMTDEHAPTSLASA